MEEKYPLALPINTVLAGKYVIDKVLGQGGFGITYKARNYITGEEVAIKEFFPDSLATRTGTTVTSFSGEKKDYFDYGKTCFIQEAETLAQFSDVSGVVNIQSFFEENDTAYFVMEFIEGTSFDAYLKQRGGIISYEEAERILLPVIEALEQVHNQGIVHRDVTPDNIYITRDGRIKLLDFGAARYSLGDKSRSLDVILKHGYAPKEQYSRRGKQGPYTDVYTVGACFYVALTGKRPPDSIDRMDEDELVPPRQLGVAISEDLETVILMAMAVQPNNRFQTMRAFRSALLNAKEKSVKETVSNTVAVFPEGLGRTDVKEIRLSKGTKILNHSAAENASENTAASSRSNAAMSVNNMNTPQNRNMAAGAQAAYRGSVPFVGNHGGNMSMPMTGYPVQPMEAAAKGTTKHAAKYRLINTAVVLLGMAFSPFFVEGAGQGVGSLLGIIGVAAILGFILVGIGAHNRKIGKKYIALWNVGFAFLVLSLGYFPYWLLWYIFVTPYVELITAAIPVLFVGCFWRKNSTTQGQLVHPQRNKKYFIPLNIATACLLFDYGVYTTLSRMWERLPVWPFLILSILLVFIGFVRRQKRKTCHALINIGFAIFMISLGSALSYWRFSRLMAVIIRFFGFVGILCYLIGIIVWNATSVKEGRRIGRRKGFVAANVASLLCFYGVGVWIAMLATNDYRFWHVLYGVALAGIIFLIVGAGSRIRNDASYSKMWNIGFACVAVSVNILIEPFFCYFLNWARYPIGFALLQSAVIAVIAVPLYIVSSKRRRLIGDGPFEQRSVPLKQHR
ncbi:MAG: serine/threonine protein kinase [Lachnospiraceae bacterium]|nr:serine/threonine protein kinase [Lachnospiraceae bacterium]